MPRRAAWPGRATALALFSHLWRGDAIARLDAKRGEHIGQPAREVDEFGVGQLDPSGRAMNILERSAENAASKSCNRLLDIAGLGGRS